MWFSSVLCVLQGRCQRKSAGRAIKVEGACTAPLPPSPPLSALILVFVPVRGDAPSLRMLQWPGSLLAQALRHCWLPAVAQVTPHTAALMVAVAHGERICDQKANTSYNSDAVHSPFLKNPLSICWWWLHYFYFSSLFWDMSLNFTCHNEPNLPSLSCATCSNTEWCTAGITRVC